MVSWTGSDPVTPNDKPWGPGYPALAPLASGGFVMLYWDSDFQDPWTVEPALRGQIYSADGAELGDEFHIDTVKDGNGRFYTAAGLPSGGFVVCYSQFASREGEEPGEDLWMQIYDASGNPVGDAAQVNTLTHGGQGAAEIAVLESGGFVITWNDFSGNWPTQTGGVKAQLFDAGGGRVGGEFLVPPEVVLRQSSPAVTALPDGGFVIAWEEDELGGDTRAILAQRFDGDGNRVGHVFEVVGPGDGYIFDPEVTLLADGRLAFTWTWTNGYNDPALRTARIEGQLLDADGVKQGDVFVVSTELAGDRRSSNVVALQDGGFAVTWHDSTGDGSGSAVLAQIYDSDAAKVDAAFIVNSPTDDDQRVPVTAVLAWGGIVTAWGDYGGATPGNSSTVALRIFAPQPDARDDAFLTDEATLIAGNLFADNGDGADSILANATLAVSAVNGEAAGIGAPITLPSGALLTVSADGTFSYDPNGAFDHLAGYWTGGSNVEAQDSFSYSLAGGDSATVTVTIRGLPSPEHRILGTEGDDGLSGTGDEDYIHGLGGNDLIYAGEGDDMVDGGEGSDDVSAAGGDDTLVETGTGVNYYYAGPGADTLVVDYGDAVDAIYSPYDGAADGSTDALGGAFGPLRFVHYQMVERMVVTTGAFDDTIDTPAGDDVVKLGGGNDRFFSWGGDDRIDAGAGNDTIVEWAGDDWIDGGEGTDTLAFFSAPSAVTISLAASDAQDTGGAGIDTLSGFERIVGSRFDDDLTGDGQANRLTGGLGSDRLTGGAGSDRFVFDSALGTDNVDTIVDFEAGTDKIALDPAIFAGLAGAALPDDAFVVASEAQDAGDRIVYDPATGALLYDADGAGGAAAAQFASLAAGLSLTAGDFVSAANLAPSGIDGTIGAVEDQIYLFAASDFGFSDPDGDALDGVAITTLPGSGRIFYDPDGAAGPLAPVALPEGLTVSIADIEAGRLSYLPAVNATGSARAAFQFVVRDAEGGADASPAQMTVDIAPVNDAPALAFTGGSVAENSPSGTSVGTASATDPESHPWDLVFSLDDDAGGRFAIDPASGEIVFAGSTPLNFEEAASHDITIRVADPHGGVSTEVRTIAVTDAAEKLVGTDGADVIAVPTDEDWIVVGMAGEDILTGGAGSDTLYANQDDDFLDGGAGADAMYGHEGNDLYIVDHVDDTVFELGRGGVDKVEASVSYRLPFAVEQLFLTGAAAIDGTGNGERNLLVGNDAANRLDGGENADTMSGGEGDDVYVVDHGSDVVTELADGGTDTVEAAVAHMLGPNVERLTLIGSAERGTGNDLANIITGNAGANVLNGWGGVDELRGGAGDDTYILDHWAERIVELADEGIDHASSHLSYTLPDQVEHLTLTGVANLVGNGNALANTITGNDGHNRLDGRGGADTMAGGAGHDTYVVNYAADQVIEAGSSGNDTVESSVGYTLPIHVEKLILTGSFGYDGRGNAGANTITGNPGRNFLNGGSGNDLIHGGAGNDQLMGAAGIDKLTGGAGDDRFYFNVAPGAGNADRILDFSAADDALYLLRSVFTGIGPNGPLAAGAFHQGSAAADAGDRILYDQASGNIFYDADGTGAAAALLFATVAAGTPLTHADFFIYG